MGEPRPTLYLDKGAIGFLDLRNLSDEYQICYSEATLFDLLNDQSGNRDIELRALNDASALYLYRDSDKVLSTQTDAIELMKEVDPLEIQVMSNAYRFINGGGSLTLFDVMHHQLSTLLSADDEIWDASQGFLGSFAADHTLEPLKAQKSDRWRVELQRGTKSWSQAQDTTLRSLFDKNPALSEELKEYYPETVPSPEKIQLAAMLLGVLQMGSDKGILSPDDEKSGKVARNGYVDCLHIMFGLHCCEFITTDKATFRRFHLLNDYWELQRKCSLISKDAQPGAKS